MKGTKGYSAALVVAVLSMCMVQSASSAECPNPELVVRDFLDDLESLQPGLWEEYMDDNIVYQNTGLADINGKTAFMAFITPLSALLTEFRQHIITIIGRGNFVAVERIETQRMNDNIVAAMTPIIRLQIMTQLGIAAGPLLDFLLAIALHQFESAVDGAVLTGPVGAMFELNGDCLITRWSDYYDISAFIRVLGFPTAAVPILDLPSSTAPR
jgi:limonene-1,2-epoxide hydrolase